MKQQKSQVFNFLQSLSWIIVSAHVCVYACVGGGGESMIISSTDV